AESHYTPVIVAASLSTMTSALRARLGKPKRRQDVGNRSSFESMAYCRAPSPWLTRFEAMLESDSRDRLEALKLWLSYCYGPPPQEEHEDQKPHSFTSFRPLTEEQVALAERMVRALPEDSNGNLNGNEAG